MKRFRVAISDDAEDDLDAIRAYVAAEGSPARAERLIDALLGRCGKLAALPGRGAPRDDLGPGVRTIIHKRSVTIVYRVREDAVTVVGFFYRGRDVAAALIDRR